MLIGHELIPRNCGFDCYHVCLFDPASVGDVGGRSASLSGFFPASGSAESLVRESEGNRDLHLSPDGGYAGPLGLRPDLAAPQKPALVLGRANRAALVVSAGGFVL